MTMNIEEMLDAYREALDSIDGIKARHKQELEDVTKQRDELQFLIREWMKEQGTKTASTDRLTVRLGEKTYVNVENWEDFYDFVQSENDLEFLAKKVKSTEVLNYIDEFGVVPPGVKVTTELTVNHRRKGN
jgi:flagellar basal body rod protein FlgF